MQFLENYKINFLFSEIGRPWDYWFLGFLIFFFPIGSWLVPSADRSILNILTIGGLVAFAAWRVWPCSRRETLVVFSMLFLLLIPFLSWWINGLEDADYHLVRRRLLFLFAVLSLFWVARRRPSDSFFWLGIALGAFLIGLIGLYFFSLGGNFRHSIRTYTQVNPIAFGQFAVMLSALAAASAPWFYRVRPWLVFLPVSGVILGLLAAVGSATRGAWIALPVLFIMLGWYYRSGLRRHVWKVVFACLIFLVSFYGFSGLQILEHRLGEAVVHLSDYLENPENSQSNSVTIRLQMWQAAFESGIKSPVIGPGKAGYQRMARAGVDSGKYHSRVAELHFPHSAFATAFGYNGILGLLSLLLVLVIPGWVFWKRVTQAPDNNCRSIAFAGLLVVVSYAFFSLTESPFEQRLTINFYAMMVLFALTVSAAGDDVRKKKAP